MEKNNTEIFWEKCYLIKNQYDKVYSATEIEDLFIDLLIFIKNHIESQYEFENCFLDLLSNRKRGPYEIIVFCMRELQWQKIKNAVIDRIETTDDPRIHSCMNDILDVYEKNWDGQDIYKYYNRES